MANHRKRIWLLLALGAGLTVLVLVVLASRRDAPAVPVASVAREDLTETITSNGKVEPISPMVAHAEFPAFVAKVTATEGQPVRRGQTILSLDASDIESQLAQARADLLAAQTDLRNARAGGPPDQAAQLEGDLQQAKVEVASLERTQKALEKLVSDHAATQDDLAQNQANLAKARARLQAFETRQASMTQQATVNVVSSNLRVQQEQELIRSLEEKAHSAVVVAPFDGILYSLPVRPGDYVKVGDTLAEMADLRQVRVRAFVDEPDLGWLAPNQEVEVTWDAKLGQIWKGRTEQVPEQVVQHGMRSVGEVLCSVDNDKLELLPNVNVEVRILVRERRAALVVPRSAVREDKGQYYAFLVDGDEIHRRNIAVGIASATKYEVLSGLALNDRVALPGDQELRDGMEIRTTVAN